MVRMERVFKFRWLLHVDCIVKDAMRKCIGDIELKNLPIASNGNREENLKSGELRVRAKCVKIVFFMFLLVTKSPQASFVFGDGTIIIKLIFVPIYNR